MFSANPKRAEVEAKKRVIFQTLKTEVTPTPLTTPLPEEVDKPVGNPIPLPRSNSMGGLSSLSKSVSKQQEQVDELTSIIEQFKDIIAKYENEIKELQQDNKQRDILIKQYEAKYKEIEKAITDIWNS